jgi:hypothetical protein
MNGKDIKWLKASISRYYRIMIFFLVIPWILFFFIGFIYPLLLPRDYSEILIRVFAVLITLSLVMGMFLFIIWRRAVIRIEKNFEFIAEFIKRSNNKISIQDFSPFGDYSSKVNRTVTFFSTNNKYPELFYLEFGEQPDPFDRLIKYRGYKFRNPYLCIGIPFGSFPRISIYDQEVKIDDQEIKKRIRDIIEDLNPTDYIISKQHLSGFGGIPKENRLVAGFIKKNFTINDLLETLKILNQIRKVTYGDEKIDSKSFSTFNRYLGGPYDCMKIFYCSNCNKVRDITDLTWGKIDKKTCSSCGEELVQDIQRWNQ